MPKRKVKEEKQDTPDKVVIKQEKLEKSKTPVSLAVATSNPGDAVMSLEAVPAGESPKEPKRNFKQGKVDNNQKVPIKQELLEKGESSGLSLADAAKKPGSAVASMKSPPAREPPKKLMSFKSVAPQAAATVKPPAPKTSLLSTLLNPSSAQTEKSLFKINKAASNQSLAEKDTKKPKGPKAPREKKDKKGFVKKFDKNERFEQLSGAFSLGVNDDRRKHAESLRAASSGSGPRRASSRKPTKREEIERVLGDSGDEDEETALEDLPVLLGGMQLSKAEPSPKTEVKVEPDVAWPEAVKQEKVEDVQSSVSEEPFLMLAQLPDRLPFTWPKEQVTKAGVLKMENDRMVVTLGGIPFEMRPLKKKTYLQEALSISLYDSENRLGYLQNLGRVKENYALIPCCLIPPADPFDEPEPA